MKHNKVTYTSGDRTLVIDGTWLELRDNNSNRLNVILMDRFYSHISSMSVRRMEKIGKLLFLLLNIEKKHKRFTELMIFNERGEVITPFETRPKGDLVKRSCGRKNMKNEYTIPVVYENSFLFKRGDSKIDLHELAENRVLLLKFNEEGVIEYGRVKIERFKDTYIVLKRMRSSWKFTREEGKMFASIEIGGKEFKIDGVRVYENEKLFGGSFEVWRETTKIFCKKILSYDGKAYINIPDGCCVDPLGVNLAKIQKLLDWRDQYSVISRSGKVVIPNIVAKTVYKKDPEIKCQFNPVNDDKTGNEKVLIILINNKPVGCVTGNDIEVGGRYTSDSEVLFMDEYIKLYMKQENPFKDGTSEALAFDIMKYEVRKNYLLSL